MNKKTVELHVVCGGCGDTLTPSVDTSTYGVDFSVDPCEKCVEAAEEEIEEKVVAQVDIADDLATERDELLAQVSELEGKVDKLETDLETVEEASKHE